MVSHMHNKCYQKRKTTTAISVSNYKSKPIDTYKENGLSSIAIEIPTTMVKAHIQIFILPTIYIYTIWLSTFTVPKIQRNTGTLGLDFDSVTGKHGNKVSL